MAAKVPIKCATEIKDHHGRWFKVLVHHKNRMHVDTTIGPNSCAPFPIITDYVRYDDIIDWR
jgi:hypothetical protein